MKITFGKYEGQEIEDIAKDEKGRQYLGWLIDQPVENNKWKQKNEDRNDYIRKVLGNALATKGKEVPKEIEKKDDLKIIQVQLDTIVNMINELLKR